MQDPHTFEVQIAGGARPPKHDNAEDFDEPEDYDGWLARRGLPDGVGIHKGIGPRPAQLAGPFLSPPPPNPREDRRFGSRRWKRVRDRVKNRDLWTCRIVPGCTTRATVADHIIPVYPGMPDGLFFRMDNLRAGCQAHNKARGSVPDLFSASKSTPSNVVSRDYTRIR